MIDDEWVCTGERVALVLPDASLAPAVREALQGSYAEHRAFLFWVKSEWSLDEVVKSLVCARENTLSENGELRFYVIDKDDRSVVGCIGAVITNLSIPYFEIGYWANTAKTGRGYMTESVKLLVSFLKRNYAPLRIEITMAKRNERSFHVARRAGFVQEALLKHHRVLPDGRVDDTVLMVYPG
ncbi:GNAT family N-acetyltransferase [Paludibacterium paludis]|uniref:N-acetyltransferase n=1 Tax=Paludibacterium paludis TaxID=1225769 RepID=A0A918P1Y4_9NEIS|nr:GNAT family protein [Paludibacterium paludis]GGY13291.1 N-acetyltransferase [Paludibacterium paludis]